MACTKSFQDETRDARLDEVVQLDQEVGTDQRRCTHGIEHLHLPTLDVTDDNRSLAASENRLQLACRADPADRQSIVHIVQTGKVSNPLSTTRHRLECDRPSVWHPRQETDGIVALSGTGVDHEIVLSRCDISNERRHLELVCPEKLRADRDPIRNMNQGESGKRPRHDPPTCPAEHLGIASPNSPP